ncbi:DegT/DnrJ/EryC1/StrS family aminotransferase [Leptospira vanthielii]|uniref:DegT/DnrJ/EryC1/StrS aminotransferase family protein n=1 Tax=Leptospira vanthielii serovar Holland str. Waz Holland = ATCC 700522 TaxID=1218591 RepID=N1W0J2_9LEPT|nr:DegT/DnrJ/EryC1/StrS family aminotransferase [Leptospira vanthielii]EMY69729.1 DegT/DnrJ/EryC1/StrS aminotransferase family protein [Leptospira vanthielii serovar Holland str. Waz Holland = ATCC 700522]
MNKLIRLSKSCLSESEKQAVLKVLDKEFLGMGAETQEFENLLGEYFGRDTVCINTGTAALQLALQACGIGQGDEVLVQSLTYLASFQAISATGAKPISCDVEEEFCSIDIKDAERRITKNTKAIMPVHYGGQPGNLDAIYEFAKRYNLRIIEDAAHAFGTTYNSKKVGSFGDIVCFSFDGIKNITSGEGGCVVTSDKNVLNRISDLRLLGVENDTNKRYSGERSWEFDVTEQGWRYHMSNIMAAIGIEQLKRFPEMAQKRQSLAKLYDTLLREVKNVKIFNRNYDEIVPHIYPIRLQNVRNRDELRKNLLERGIQTGLHYQPNHWLSFYKANGTQYLPVTDKIYSELLTLPLHYDLSEEDVRFVCTELGQLIDV